MQRLSFEGENKKVESCFAPSGHKGVEHFEPQLTQLAYFGKRFREGNIRYNETFTDRPSFQPPLSFASIEDTLTETFLQVCPAKTMPEQHGKMWGEKHLSSLLFTCFCNQKVLFPWSMVTLTMSAAAVRKLLFLHKSSLLLSLQKQFFSCWRFECLVVSKKVKIQSLNQNWIIFLSKCRL